MWNPMWERVVTLAIFVVFSYLVVNTKERNKNELKTQE